MSISGLNPNTLVVADSLRKSKIDPGLMVLALEGLDPDPANRRSSTARAVAERTVAIVVAAARPGNPDNLKKATASVNDAARFCFYAAADERLN